MSEKKYVIIGGGAGGMFAAATLAHFGHKVTLVEAHYALGGLASSFKRKNSEHEIAIHALSNVREGSFEYHWYKKLGIVENIEYEEIEDFLDVYIGEKYFKIPTPMEKSKQYLVGKFPHEEKGLNDFFCYLSDLINELDAFLSSKADVFNGLRNPRSNVLAKKTCDQFLNELFTDQLLIKVLEANYQLFHNDPKKLSALNYMHGTAYYLNKGVRFIKGTSHTLMKYLQKRIEEAGGKILTGHIVDGLANDHEKIHAISVLKRSTGEKILIEGDHFIFNNYPPIVKKWLGAEAEIINCFEKVSASSCNLYLEYDRPLREFGVKAYFNAIILSGKEILNIPEIDQFALVDYSFIDSRLSEDKFLASVLYLDEYDNWSHLSKKEYDQKKQDRTKTIFKILDKYFPDLSTACSRVDFATPLTVERYTQNHRGASYGYSCSLEDNRHDRDYVTLTRSYNMSFASGWVLGGGLSLASCSGIKTVLDLLGVDYFAD